MSLLDDAQILAIETILRDAIRKKLSKYKPEPAAMPFHTRLLGRDRLALFSFIHSMNTVFGTAIFERVALQLAKNSFKEALTQKVVGTQISTTAYAVIQQIINNLTIGTYWPNKPDEIERIREVCQKGEMQEVKPTKADIWLQTESGALFLFDLKTAKPYISDFKAFKRTLLEWVACVLAQNPNAIVYTGIAIPYNPYSPNPYDRWTMRGMLDIKHELKVAEEFWDFLGGDGTYSQLLDIFEKTGNELRPEIDTYFKKFLMD